MVLVTAPMFLATACGLVMGVGLWMLVSLVPRLSRPSLSARIAPYLLDVSGEARQLVGRRPADPTPLFTAVLAPVFARATSALSIVMGGDESVARRLRQSGSTLGVAALRSRQLLGGALGALIGLMVATLIWYEGALPWMVGVAVIVVGTGLGVLAPEQLLTRAARQRLDRVSEELPTVLEFLTLSLSAGEGLLDAVSRVARTGSGELSVELGAVVADVHAGAPLATALQRCSDALGLAALNRAVDQLIPALERGTPLVDVLRAQADDVREQARRDLIESAGRKEVTMLVPLVFLILPVTIALAILPISIIGNGR